jgi:hypothetical protein
MVFGIVGDAQEFLNLAEVLIDVTTIYTEWQSGDYFEAGLYLGKGVVNCFFSLYKIVSKYVSY